MSDAAQPDVRRSFAPIYPVVWPTSTRPQMVHHHVDNIVEWRQGTRR